jgi:hypothetical protein
MLRVQSHGHRQVGLTARQRMARSLRRALAFSARIADENVSCPTAIVMLDHGFGMIVPGELASQPRKVCLWRIAALGFVANNFRLLTTAEVGEPFLAPIYEFTASFRKWPSIVFTAGGSCSG